MHDDDFNAPEGQRKLQHQFQISQPSARLPQKVVNPGVPITNGQKDIRRGSNTDLEEVINVITKPRKSTIVADASDEIEEYTFSSEEDNLQHDDGYDSDAAQSHISVSSSESPDKVSRRYAIEERPWLHMTPQTRLGYESMFLNIASPIGQCWDHTEEYQLQVDILMLKYMEDFPLSTWAVGGDAAEQAFRKFRHRVSMRQIGVKIYSTERLPEILRGTNGIPPMPYQRPEPIPAQPQVLHETQPAQNFQAIPRYPDVPKQSQRQPPADIPVRPAKPSPNTNFNSAFAASILLSHTDDNRKKGSKLVLPLDQDSLDDDDTDDDAEISIRRHRYNFHSQATSSSPPYPQRERPVERKVSLKLGKRNVRKQAEAETFPWHRQINFDRAKREAAWNDNYRNPETIAQMIRIRAHNTPIIEALDLEVTEKQRKSCDVMPSLC